MTKYTKAQYNRDIANNNEYSSEVKARLNALAVFADNGGNVTEKISQNWNDLHDREWELQQERETIERRWNRRNWTWQDHSEHDLVTQNID